MLWLLPAHDVESHWTPAPAINYRFRGRLPGTASRLRDRSRRRQIARRLCLSIRRRGFRNPSPRWTGKRVERRAGLHPARLRFDRYGTTILSCPHNALCRCYDHSNGLRETRFRRCGRCHSPRRVAGWRRPALTSPRFGGGPALRINGRRPSIARSCLLAARSPHRRAVRTRFRW